MYICRFRISTGVRSPQHSYIVFKITSISAGVRCMFTQVCSGEGKEPQVSNAFFHGLSLGAGPARWKNTLEALDAVLKLTD